ncbi:MAG: M81 family metallopeptidase [Halobacteriales archaeon]
MAETSDSQTSAGLDVVGEDFTIGIARFSMETCTFCPRPTGIEEWEYYGPPIDGSTVLDANDYIRGFVSRTREVSGSELVGAYSPRRPVGGSSGSWVTEEAFEKYATGIAEDLATIDGLDGVYLSLHGAMAVDGVPKPEAETARRVREAVGDRPIYVTLDLHANIDHELAEAADAVFIIKRYPHYDSRYQGERAARVLHRQLRSGYEPTMATRKPGVITPSVFQGTAESPAMEIMERARRWECREKDVFASVAFGFAYADVPTVGATVMVLTNGDQNLADRIADDLSEYIWRVRESFAGKTLPDTETGVRQAIEAAAAGKTPVIIADHADRTGNSTHVLAELIDQDASDFVIATINDERAIETIAQQATVGDTVTVEVGGYADQYAGDPVEITGEVEYLGSYSDHYHEFETIVVLRFGQNNRVILTPSLHQVTSPEIFDELDISFPVDVDIVSLKSRVHFRRGFVETGIAGEVIKVDAPGLGPADLSKLPYENIPEDIYPLGEQYRT